MSLAVRKLARSSEFVFQFLRCKLYHWKIWERCIEKKIYINHLPSILINKLKMSTWHLLYTGGNLSRVTTRWDTEESSTERQAWLELSCQLEPRIWHALDPPSETALSNAPYCYFGKTTKVVPLVFNLGFLAVIPIRYRTSHWHCC